MNRMILAASLAVSALAGGCAVDSEEALAESAGAATARCDVSLVDATVTGQSYDVASDTYYNHVVFAVKNRSGRAVDGTILVDHTLPSGEKIPTQSFPLTLPDGETAFEIPFRYAEAKYGPEFGRNVGWVRFACDDRKTSVSYQFTRTRDAADPPTSPRSNGPE